jgi:hypothetical protein
MSCLSRQSAWGRTWRNLLADTRALVLGTVGIALFIIGIFTPEDSRALALLGFGVGLVVLAVLLSSIKEGDIGPKGLSFKRELPSQDATFQPVLADIERRQFVRFASLLSGSPNRAESFVEQSVFRAYAHWKHVPPHARRPVLYCHLIESVGGAEKLGVVAPAAAHLLRSGDTPQEDAELASVLPALATRLRAALLLRYLAGLNDKEIALALGVSEREARDQLASAEVLLEHHQAQARESFTS